jgi:8-oxo-dGTP pyrophosphatase MutT (NUDIX family)
VLLVKRSGKSGFMAGAEVFPGGRVEDGESYVDAAVRETAEEAGIALAPTSLSWWSHWITPEAEPKRFDTRFFLAQVPADTRCTVDAHEAVSFRWLDPRSVADVYGAGGLVLAPPTLATLEDLAAFSSVADAARAARSPPPMVCPLMVTEDTTLVLALPGDPLHPERARAFERRTRIVMDAHGRFSSQIASATGGA